MFGDSHLIAQATYPVAIFVLLNILLHIYEAYRNAIYFAQLLCIRRGFRSIPLKNGFSELLEMASLLVFLDLHKRKVIQSRTIRDSALMAKMLRQDEGSSVLLKRDKLRDLRTQIIDAQERGDEVAAQEARAEFHEIESQIFEDFNRTREK